ncbi:MAG: chromate resistance protein [Nitrospirae bacterium]|nr:chromate resistance protein [Nitrospirota bacterium]
MKIWRRLSKAGAVQLKGAVYALPYSDEHYEFFQWLTSEVSTMKGDAAFVRVETIETMKNSEIIGIFNQQREKDYGVLMKDLEDLARKISSVRKGGKAQDNKKLTEQMIRLDKEFQGIRAVDFFSSNAGEEIKRHFKTLQSEMRDMTESGGKEQKITLAPKRIEDYQNMTWVTRKRPFVDRMASAWLIKKFIDKNAVFRFIDEKDIDSLDKGAVAFDIRSGEFTHIGEMCTFEVLVKSFNLKDKTLRKIAEIVHELDIKDGKYSNAEAKGVEGLLRGIRKTVATDEDGLGKGIEMFEMLYASKS